MDARQKEVVKKIRKLLALAENAGSEDEAATAMRMAREMLAKYELSLGEVKEFAEKECGEAEFHFRKKYMPAYLKILVNAINRLYQCRAYTSKNFVFGRNDHSVTFVGVGADAVIACQTLEFLLAFAKCRAKERGIRQKDKDDYLYGFAYSILGRVQEIVAQSEKSDSHSQRLSEALVPVKNAAIDRFLEKRLGKTQALPGPKKRFVSDEVAAGFADGKTANLDRPLAAEKRDALA